MSSQPHLRATDLRRSFRIGRNRIDVLRGISLEVSAGESIFLCGASGAGKTTLLYTLAGLERPEGGEVHFEETSLYAIGSDRLSRLRNQRMGFVFQSYFLLPELTALENVLVPAMIGKREATDVAESLLERVGLADRRDHLPSELSGGEQQRVAIARAIAKNPRMLLCDEPTGALDFETGKSMLRLLVDLKHNLHKTVVVITHNSALAEVADRVIHLRSGQVTEVGVNAEPREPEEITW